MDLFPTKKFLSNLTIEELEYIEKNKFIPKCVKIDRNHYSFIYKDKIVNIKNCTTNLFLTIMGHDQYREELVKRKLPKDENLLNKWSILVKKDKMCLKCGNIANHAHHIFNKYDNKEKMYDLDNGAPLCQKCHISFHSKYGRRHNTNQQLEEFINE